MEKLYVRHVILYIWWNAYEPPHNKTNNVAVH